MVFIKISPRSRVELAFLMFLAVVTSTRFPRGAASNGARQRVPGRALQPPLVLQSPVCPELLPMVLPAGLELAWARAGKGGGLTEGLTEGLSSYMSCLDIGVELSVSAQ